jgi:hypothetical protein
MTVVNVDANPAALIGAAKNAKGGDTLALKSGTIVLPSAVPQINVHRLSIVAEGDVILRPRMTPHTYSGQAGWIAGMNALRFAGAFEALSAADQNAVKVYLSANKPDVTAVTNLLSTYLSSLKPITDTRLFVANPETHGQITYNGKTYDFKVKWGANISKGIFTIGEGVMGTLFRGLIFENARMGGSSDNAAAIRSQGIDHWIEECTFRDCDDSILSGRRDMPNPNGEWFSDNPNVGRVDMFGHHIDKKCTFDNSGFGGQAHGEYDGPALFNASFFPHVIRTHDGNGIKKNGGLQLVYEGRVEDLKDTSGELQAIDLDSGVGYVINSYVVKQTKGTGNYGPVILFRNDREPAPPWLPPRCVVMGNRIDYLLSDNTKMGFVGIINAAQYHKSGAGTIWPGVPTPITGIVDRNVLVCNLGSPISKMPLVLPAGVVVGNNPVMDVKDPNIPDVRIPMPNFALTRDSWRADVAEVLHKVDPGRDWEQKLFSFPIYPSVPGAPPEPSSVFVPAPVPVDPPVPTPQPAPEPGPAQEPPVPEPPAPSDQEIIAALRKQLADATVAAEATKDELARLKANVRANVADLSKELAELTQEVGGG